MTSPAATRRGARAPQPRAKFTWNRLLWALIYPSRSQRVMPTISGMLLVAISFGVGIAAYNAANNILFITLSLLLACLIASGVLSWLNFRRLSWSFDIQPPMRAGLTTSVGLSVRNDKRFLPTYGLWFEVVARSVERPATLRAETTFTARGAEVRAALAEAEKRQVRTVLSLSGALDPGGTARLDWSFVPPGRGLVQLELRRVGSLFPFGFLRKEFSARLDETVVAWPAAVEYSRHPARVIRRSGGGERLPRRGSGEDLFALRRYQWGDSHRLIHWKASARTQQLLVREFSAESAEGYALWLQTGGVRWSNQAQYELLLSFAATLAEDLFRAGWLLHLALDQDAAGEVRRLADLEGWLDSVAQLPAWDDRPEEPVVPAGAVRARWRPHLITFAPEGSRGIRAEVDGQPLASV